MRPLRRKREDRSAERWSRSCSCFVVVEVSTDDATTSGESINPQRDASSDQRVEERYSPRHLSRDLLVLQKLIECPANDFVAFARSGFQPLVVDDLDSPASITY